MNRDMTFGGTALALAVGYYLLADAIPPSMLADAVGPDGLPKTYAYVLAGLSLILIARSVRDSGSAARDSGAKPRTPDPEPGTSSPEPRAPDPVSRAPRPALRAAGMLAIGMAYVLVVPWLGYLPSLALLMLATVLYRGGVAVRHAVVVTVSGAVLFWLLFVVLLGIPHPPGFWPSVFQP